MIVSIEFNCVEELQDWDWIHVFLINLNLNGLKIVKVAAFTILHIFFITEIPH